MQDTSQQIIITITAISIILLFLGVLFIVMLVYYGKKKKQIDKEKADMQAAFAQQLLQSQLEVQEQTRLYIAEELHDNIGALSSLIKINLNLLTTSDEAARRQQLLAESKTLIKTLITDVKQLSISLHADRLSHLGITDAINLEVERLQKLQLFTIQLSTQGDEVSLPSDKQLILFRICQELLHNIVKHAQPTLVTVSLHFTPKLLEIIITDDGIGFDVAATTKQMMGSGLINLYNRAKLMGGSLYLSSNMASGTRCTIQVPTSA